MQTCKPCGVLDVSSLCIPPIVDLKGLDVWPFIMLPSAPVWACDALHAGADYCGKHPDPDLRRDGVICYWYNLLTTDPNKNTYQLVFLCLHFYIYTVEELPLQSLTRDVYLSICIANLPCGVVFWIEVFSEVFSECLRNVVRFWATEDSPLNHSWKILAWS